MNEKRFFIFIICAFLFASCRTTVLYNGSTATEVRDNLSELQSAQSDAAGTAGKITEQSAELADRIRDAANTASEGARNNKELESILGTIRNQKLPERSGENAAPAGPGSTESENP